MAVRWLDERSRNESVVSERVWRGECGYVVSGCGVGEVGVVWRSVMSVSMVVRLL